MTNRATEFRPDLIIAPGEHIKDLLQEKGWTQRELAKRMGRPYQVINEIVNGKTAITAETALQLEVVLKVSAETWMNLESNYRLSLARQGAPKYNVYLDVLDAFVQEKNYSDRAAWLRNFLARVFDVADDFGGSGSTVIYRTLEALNSGDPTVQEWKSNTPNHLVREFMQVAQVVVR